MALCCDLQTSANCQWPRFSRGLTCLILGLLMGAVTLAMSPQLPAQAAPGSPGPTLAACRSLPAAPSSDTRLSFLGCLTEAGSGRLGLWSGQLVSSRSAQM